MVWIPEKNFFKKNEKSLVFLVLVFIGNILIMNKSQRIYFSTGSTGNEYQDKYVKVKLEQETETLEFMSMSLGTADVYQEFNSDYGVLVGRVIANGGIGIPNARISVFIPLEDEDAENSEYYSIYPYKTPRDKNNEGKRYNLLPRVSKVNEIGQAVPKQPFGSFPIKEEIVGNEPFLDIYKKYYKYTALTNKDGDYMIFGVPIGSRTIHLSVDITDIGEFSMNPASMVTNLGYSPNLFTDNNTKIKPSNDLNDLPNIETQEITVDIRPFWGDTENFEIGITRQDFRIRSVLTNTFVIFGSVFTDGLNSQWGWNFDSQERIGELFRASTPARNILGIGNKRIGKVTEKIYYYPNTVSDSAIITADPTKDMLVLDPTEYSVYKRDGDFAFIISCNRDKVITNEAGDLIPVSDDSVEGIFTSFKGFFSLELTDEAVPMNWTHEMSGDMKIAPHRYKLKFPQYANRNATFIKPQSSGTDYPTTETWRKQYKTFEGGKFYSVAKHHTVISNGDFPDADQFSTDAGFFKKDVFNDVYNKDSFWNVGVIQTEDDPDVANESKQFPSNSNDTYGNDMFGANWMNLSIHLPQVGHLYDGYHQTRYVRVTDHFSNQDDDDDFGRNNYYYKDNVQEIAGGDFNTKFFARSDVNWTDIIEVPITDIYAMNSPSVPKGFKKTTLPSLTGAEYRNGEYLNPTWTVIEPCPLGGGKEDGDPALGPDSEFYFYKGYDSADCIEFLADLGII